MDKEEKIIDLKIKKIELGLEKDKELHRLLLASLGGVLAFFVTSNYISDTIKNQFTNSLSNFIIFLSNYIPLFIILILLVIVIPLLAAIIGYKVTEVILSAIIKSHNRLYQEKIDSIEELIHNLEESIKK